MSYHVLTIDAPNCQLTCKNKQLVFHTKDSCHSLPMEDISAILITSFSCNLHHSLLLEAAKFGIGLIVCDKFKPTALLLPADRASDTLLLRRQIKLSGSLRKRLWQKTIDAKCRNQALLAQHLDPQHAQLAQLQQLSNAQFDTKEAQCAKLYWHIYSDALQLDHFCRDRQGEGVNLALNYVYGILLCTTLQKCFAVGLDPTFGLGHVEREHATPLAYDLMEPFRPCCDELLARLIKKNPHIKQCSWLDHELKSGLQQIVKMPIAHEYGHMQLQSALEHSIRSLRAALLAEESRQYEPWTPITTKWDG